MSELSKKVRADEQRRAKEAGYDYHGIQGDGKNLLALCDEVERLEDKLPRPHEEFDGIAAELKDLSDKVGFLANRVSAEEGINPLLRNACEAAVALLKKNGMTQVLSLQQALLDAGYSL